MAVKRRTWCRVCGAPLRLPRWKALIGLNVAYCPDQQACLGRYEAKRNRSGALAAPVAPVAPVAPISSSPHRKDRATSASRLRLRRLIHH